LKTTIRTLLYAALCAAAAKGAAITITETQLGIGSLDGTAFNNLMVTITVTGDTSAIVSPASGVLDIFGTATVSVATLGTDTFTDSIGAFVNNNIAVAGISDFNVGGAIVDTSNAAFATYPFTTSIGPFSSSPEGNPSDSFATLGGSFILSTGSNADHPSTFTATVAATAPEPGTIVSCAAGIGMVLITRRRRK
jgi:hypothetical protein